jgi:hypothetical protein
MANGLSWAARKISLACSTFMSMNTEILDSPEIRNIFHLHYGAVNQSHSQQMCL